MQQKSVIILLTTLFCYVSTFTQTALANTHKAQAIEPQQVMEYRLSQNEKNPWEAMGLNLIPFGVGSFRQGDQVGGTTIAVLDGVAALGALSFGIKAAQGMSTTLELAAIIAGLCLGRVVGWIAPWSYWINLHTPSSNKSQTHQSQIIDSPSLWSYQLNF